MMKKIIKITAITLASLVGLIIIVLGIAMWLVLTPSRLTPIVKEQAGRFISCQTNLDEVELTIFETFPDIGLKIKNLQVINPLPGAPNDTLASVEYCTVGLNVKELITNKSIIVHQFYLKNGFANLFVDSLGKANYDILITTDTSKSTFKIEKIDLQKLIVENVDLAYTNIPSKIHTKTKNVNLAAKGKMKNETISGQLDLKMGNTVFQLNDSVPLFASVKGLETKFDGIFADFNEIEGLLQLSLHDIYFSMNDTQYVDSMQFTLNSPLRLLIDKESFKTSKTDLTINEHLIILDGFLARNSENGSINLDMGFKTNTWNIEKILKLLPNAVKSKLPEMKVTGNIKLNGKASGMYNDSLFPVISADVMYSNGKFAMDSIPFDFNDINAKCRIDLDLNARSKLVIHNLDTKTGNNTIKMSGTIDDLLNKMFFDVNANIQMALCDLKPVLPPEIKAKGFSNTTVHAKFTQEQLSKLALEKMIFSGTTTLTDLSLVYNDSLKIKSSETHVQFESSNLNKNKISDELLHTKIQSKDLKINMLDFLSVNAQDANLDLAMSNVLDTTKLVTVSCDFDFDNFNMEMDSINVKISKPAGNILLTPSKRNPKNPTVKYTYQNGSLLAHVGNNFTAQTQKLNMSGSVSYNDKEQEPVLKWNPILKMDLQEGKLNIAALPTAVYLPSVKFDFSSRKFNIQESRIKLGNSDFNLSGMITNINKYMRKTGLLKAELEFVSENTDVSQLMNYINGLGLGTDTAANSNEVEHKEDNPFMVPLGVDISLNTRVKKAWVGDAELHNLHGMLTVKDGVLVLQEMGFTSEAARMQLTAIYRSPRKNHLFVSMDFHLLDIDIAKLIKMIPAVDTIVPMLKSFAGKAEFHFAIETYLKSNYDLKYSTLLGSAAINGQDLVLMDNETFATISKTLLFKKKTKNVIDSLSVEWTIRRNEMEVFPFLISMDKYKAVIAGKHNLDMSLKYHISVTDTPLPLRLGLNISGNLDKLKYKVVRCKYPKMYRPGKENAVDKKILELKKIISDALKANVKE